MVINDHITYVGGKYSFMLRVNKEVFLTISTKILRGLIIINARKILMQDKFLSVIVR